MNKIIFGLVSFLALASTSSFASLKDVRSAFKSGKLPTEAELKLGNDWNCSLIMGHRNNPETGKAPAAFNFSKSGSSYINDGDVTGAEFMYASGELLGNADDGEMSIRVDRKKNLIVEYVTKEPGYADLAGLVKSERNSKYAVLMYLVCSTGEIPKL
jgi:hypothetical protein